MIITSAVASSPSPPQTVRSPPLLVSGAAVMSEFTAATPRATAFSLYQPQTATAATLVSSTLNNGRPPLPQSTPLNGAIIFTPSMPHRPIPVSPAVAVSRILPSPSSAFRLPITSATVTVGHVMDSTAQQTLLATAPHANTVAFAEHNTAATHTLSGPTSATPIATPIAVEATVVPLEHQVGDSFVENVMSSLTATLSKATTSAISERDQLLRQTQRARSSHSIQTLIGAFVSALKHTPVSPSPPLLSPSSSASSLSSAANDRTMTFDDCAQLLSLVVNTIESDELLAAHHSCPNCSSSNKGSRWSSSDDTAMLQLIDTGLDFPAIANKLKRTVRALKDRYCLLKKNKGALPINEHEHARHHTSKSTVDDTADALDSPSSASETSDKKRSRQRHRSRDHRQRVGKRMKLKKRDVAFPSSYEDADSHDHLSDVSSTDSESERYRHQQPPSASAATASVSSTNPPSSTIKPHNEHRKSSSSHSQPNDFADGQVEGAPHQHHYHHHHQRRRYSHTLLSPVSPPHLDEMDVSTDDDDSHSATSNESGGRISREDESSALDSLTKLSSATQINEKLQIHKIPFVSRQISQTPSLLVALSHM